MATDFCHHLDDYAHHWARAEAAYGAMNAAVERIFEGGPQESYVDVMDVALRDWRYEVHHLRERFMEAVKRGLITLPADAGEADAARDGACCARCGHAIPRLSWPEWAPDDAGGVTYRGEELPASQPV